MNGEILVVRVRVVDMLVGSLIYDERLVSST